ncbi:MAG: methyl-accepting chemotaxis protein [Geobacteraceae bacterium]
MVSFGLFMGLIFPFYSYLFFGAKAFSPLYVIGTVTAGVMIGIFCYYSIKQVLNSIVETQWQTLKRITGNAELETIASGGDELKRVLECYELLMSRILTMVENVLALIARISPLYRQLNEQSRLMVQGNEHQAASEKEALRAAGETIAYFGALLKEIEAISARSEEQASISSQMSAATDAIADNIKAYSSSVLETSASMEEMAASINETTGNIGALAASTEETSASINQITTAIANVRDNAQNAAEQSENVRHLAQEGMSAMSATLQAMREIEQSNEESVASINRLAVYSARVGEFLNIIQDVVEQTNLLSLNAAIIAAQAGERGNAFAVVAEEVRSLARRSAASAGEIKDLVKNIRQETEGVQKTVAQGKEKVLSGVKISAQARDALSKIETSAAETSAMVQKIATATVEQASGGRLITEEAEKNLERLKQATKASQEQETGIGMIVRELENMGMLSQKITVSTQEQARGNRLHMKSVLEDNEKIKALWETSTQQMSVGKVLLNYVREAGSLIESNATAARVNMMEIETITRLTDELQKELEPFKSSTTPSTPRLR